MRRINLLSGIFWCLIFTLSCTSKKSDSPVVHFVYPHVNTIHDLNEDLNIEIDISDDFMIMEYRFWLESGNGWEYYSEKKKVNKNNHKILYKFDLSESISSDFSIHLEAKDNDDNTTRKQINVTIQ
jgi:hypothetical protein